jgi:nucleotide-binding universal stress UspA family protein
VFLTQWNLGSEDEITILTVTPPDERPSATQAPFGQARCGLQKAEIAGAVVQRATGRGDSADAIADAILWEAEARRADLIVLGTRERSGIARFFLGSVAERVVRFAACSVLITRGLNGQLDQILLGYDGSEGSHHATETLLYLPIAPETHVRVLSVMPYPRSYYLAHGHLPAVITRQLASALATERKVLRERLNTLATHLQTRFANVTADYVEGHPSDALVQEAEKQKSDLLVVGARGQSAVERFLLGSVSEAVLRHAPCSVLVGR